MTSNPYGIEDFGPGGWGTTAAGETYDALVHRLKAETTGEPVPTLPPDRTAWGPAEWACWLYLIAGVREAYPSGRQLGTWLRDTHNGPRDASRWAPIHRAHSALCGVR